jgi:hypothetical protein
MGVATVAELSSDKKVDEISVIRGLVGIARSTGVLSLSTSGDAVPLNIPTISASISDDVI